MADNFITKLFGRKKKRGFEAASRKKRLKKWKAPGTSANTEGLIALDILRNRSRDLVRNNPLAFKAINVVSTNVVGHGVRTKFEGKGSEKIQLDWDKWAGSTACDFNERLNFYSLQSLVVKSVVESGEILARKRINNDKDMPLQYQLLECDFLASSSASKDKTVVQGVELDDDGRVTKYHLYKKHPGDALSSYSSFLNKALNNAEVNEFDKSEIHHVLRIDRPGQLRGIPWLSTVMVRLKDVDEFIDATIMKQKVAACFAGFVTDMSADLIDPEMIKGDETEVPSHIEPGIIEELPIGKDIKFPNPPSVEHFQEFQSILGHNIASGIGISYESLTGDLSNQSFSAGRMGWVEMGRNIDSWRNTILNDMFINKAVADFLEVYSLKNGVNTSEITWANTPPQREMLDPVKETAGLVASIRGGLISQTEAITKTGRDPEKVFAQIKKDNDKLDSLGIILDSDPRQVTGAGIIQADETEKKGVNNE